MKARPHLHTRLAPHIGFKFAGMLAVRLPIGNGLVFLFLVETSSTLDFRTDRGEHIDALTEVGKRDCHVNLLGQYGHIGTVGPNLASLLHDVVWELSLQSLELVFGRPL